MNSSCLCHPSACLPNGYLTVRLRSLFTFVKKKTKLLNFKVLYFALYIYIQIKPSNLLNVKSIKITKVGAFGFNGSCRNLKDKDEIITAIKCWDMEQFAIRCEESPQNRRALSSILKGSPRSKEKSF